MEIRCEICESVFNIPDEKIPEARSATLTCPKCKNKIMIQPKSKQHDEKPVKNADNFNFTEDDGKPDLTPKNADETCFASIQSQNESESSMERPFDFIEEEGRTALICETAPEALAQIRSVLNYLEYHVTDASNTRDALKQMRYHDYDLIILNENFDTQNPDTNGILMYISRMPISIRRNIFVALVSNRFKTLDYMMSFVKSVNMIINERNIPEFETVLQRGMADRDILYKAFRDALKRAGRA